MLANSKSPSIAFNTAAAKIKNDRNLSSWSEAYSAVCKEQPALLDAMADEDPFKELLTRGIMKNRLKAAARFNEKVLNRQAEARCSFDQAYVQVKRAEPALYRAMIGE